jgi:HlyD family secretion protein
MPPELKHLRIDRSLGEPSQVRRKWTSTNVVVGGLAVLAAAAGAMVPVFRRSAVPVEVITVRAEIGPINGSDLVLNATGYIIAAHKIEVATTVNGRVAWIGVEKGDQANQGQVLVRLESGEYLAKVQEAAGQVSYLQAKLNELTNGSRPEEIAKAGADMAEVNAQLENARVSLERTRKLFDQKVLSRQALDDATEKHNEELARFQSLERAYALTRVGPRSEEIAAARGQLKQAEGTLAYARTQYQNTVIRAPITGTILERNVEPGEFVTTGFVSDNGARGYVVSLADLHQLQVQLDISQNDFSRLVPDQRGVITTDAYPDRRYDGVIEQISPVANRQKATVEVRVKILNPDRFLRPDMNATVAFVASEEQRKVGSAVPVISVPKSAIRDQAVFVVADGKAVYRKVQIGSASGGAVHISGGLQDGEQLIVSPPAGVKDGEAVKLIRGEDQ